MTIEVAERAMKRRHELYRKYPEIKTMAESDGVVTSWVYTWSEGNRTLEEGLVMLVDKLMNARQKTFERLESVMSNLEQTEIIN